MKIGFTKYNIPVQNYKTELTAEQAGGIVIAFASEKDISTAKAELKIPRNIIEAVYKDIAEIEATVVRTMKGEATMKVATFNEKGEELTPVVYNTIPTTLTKMKELVFSLIARDYVSKATATYTIDEVEDLRLKVYSCIDQIIKYSSITKDGTWDFYSKQF